jgi:hypothetical protein
MKGDFTKSTFNKKKHYRKVNMQQGRVQLDADWNEQLAIDAHHERTSLKDIIGITGTPTEAETGYCDGFKITPPDSASTNNYNISRGRYYVDGILCENEEDKLPAGQQPDRPALLPSGKAGFESFLPPEPGTGAYIVYLDVWEKHVSYLDDPQIREVALLGPDTATRTKIVWQVKALKVSETEIPDATKVFAPENLNKTCQFDLWNKMVAPSSGTLSARIRPSSNPNGVCKLPPTAGYTGLENHLYRVEIHNRGVLKAGNSDETASAEWAFKHVADSKDARNFVNGAKPYKQAAKNATFCFLNKDTKPELYIFYQQGTAEKQRIWSLRRKLITTPEEVSDFLNGTGDYNHSPPVKDAAFSVVQNMTGKNEFYVFYQEGDADQGGGWLSRLITAGANTSAVDEVLNFLNEAAPANQPVKDARIGVSLNKDELRFQIFYKPGEAGQSGGWVSAQLPSPEEVVNLLNGGTSVLSVKNPRICSIIKDHKLAFYVFYQPQFSAATFKWSKDNGIVVSNVSGIDAENSKLTAASVIKDSIFRFTYPSWIEVTSDVEEFGGTPGTLAKAKYVDPDSNTLTFTEETHVLSNKKVNEINFPQALHPKVRKWDMDPQTELSSVQIAPNNNGYLKLGEEGVEVKFGLGTYKTGDWWLVPVRAVTSDVEWPLSKVEIYWDFLTNTTKEDGAKLSKFLKENLGINWVTQTLDYKKTVDEATNEVTASVDSHTLSICLDNDKTQATLTADGIDYEFEASAKDGATVVKFCCPAALPPEGINHHFAQLALINFKDGAVSDLIDLRRVFSPFDAAHLYYVAGDGQHTQQDGTLGTPLKAVVRIGKKPVPGCTVRFNVKEGGGALSLDNNFSTGRTATNDLPVITNDEGIAACYWKPDTYTVLQNVTAELYDVEGKPVNEPLINFCFTLPTKFYCIEGDGADGNETIFGGTLQISVQAEGVEGTNETCKLQGCPVRFTVLNSSQTTIKPTESQILQVLSNKQIIVATDDYGKVTIDVTLSDPKAKTVEIEAELLYKTKSNEYAKADVPPVFFHLSIKQPHMYYIGGDGQEGIAGKQLQFPLVVGCTNGNNIPDSASVRFSIVGTEVVGGLALTKTSSLSSSLTIPATNGQAECWWTLGTGEFQQVKAVLIDNAGKELNQTLPVIFNAKAETPQCNCTVVIKPGDDVIALAKNVPKTGGKICFSAGIFKLSQALAFTECGKIMIEGAGASTEIIVNNSESAFLFENCGKIGISYLSASSRSPSKAGTFKEHKIRGVATFLKCSEITITDCVFSCNQKVAHAQSCVTISGEKANPTTQVKIRDCTFQVGSMQNGIVLTNVDGAEVIGNLIDVAPIKNRLLINAKKTALLRKYECRNLVMSLIKPASETKQFIYALSDAKISSQLLTEALKDLKEKNYRNVNAKIKEAAKAHNKARAILSNKASDFPAYSNADLSKTLTALVSTIPASKEKAATKSYAKKGGDAVLEKNIADVSKVIEASLSTLNASVAEERKTSKAELAENRALVYSAVTMQPNKNFNSKEAQDTLEALRAKLQFGYQGIVVGGSVGRNLRISGNTVRGMIQGIHAGVSECDPQRKNTIYFAEIAVSANKIDATNPTWLSRQKHGIFVGNADVCSVKDNIVAVTFQQEAVSAPIKVAGNIIPVGSAPVGIQMFGYHGRLIHVSGNVIEGVETGVVFRTVGFLPSCSSIGCLRLISGNVITNATTPYITKGSAAEADIKLKNENNIPQPT